MGYSSFYNANITASSRSANILAGDINEFLTQDSIVTIYALSSAIGVKISVTADNETQVDRKEILGIGTTLDKSQHMVFSEEFLAGTRLAVYYDETAGAATTDVSLGVQVDYL